MFEAVHEKLRGYKPPQSSSVAETVLQIFKRHSRSDIATDEMWRIKDAVDSAMRNGRPINASFLWALSGNARSRFKFVQPHLNLPRLGDYWAFAWLHMLDRKIKTVYPLGCNFVIVDETPFVRLIPRWDERHIAIRRAAFQPILNELPNVKIIDLPDFLGIQPAELIPEPHPGEIMAILLSRPELEDALGEDTTLLYQDYYRVREKNWDALRKLVPDRLWEDAVRTRAEMSRIIALRRELDWARREVFGGQDHVNGALAEKGRWCPSIWPATSTSPQHGGSVVKGAKEGFSVAIEPEYRLTDTHEPVHISTSDLDTNSPHDTLIFYWKEVAP
jgi:hypothetical protein